MFVLRWTGAANYGAFSVAMSALLVIMLGITSIPPVMLIFARGDKMTLRGGIIALVSHILWPTNSHRLVRATIAVEVVSAQGLPQFCLRRA